MSEERDYEAEARKEGWKPKEEWNGPEEKHVDAKTFVERGESILPIVNSKLRRVEERLAAAESANKKFGEYHKKTLAKEKQNHETKIAQLEAKLEKAVTDGDGDTFTRTNRELNNLRQSPPDEPTDASEYNALVQQWVSENDWYTKDPKLGAYADGIAERIQAEGYSGRAYFKELTKRVKDDFPEKFENPNRKKPNGVEDGGERGTNPKAKSYASLPADAKKACDEFVSQGFMTREDYIKTYDWEEV
jgi:hypothetical protein